MEHPETIGRQSGGGYLSLKNTKRFAFLGQTFCYYCLYFEIANDYA